MLDTISSRRGYVITPNDGVVLTNIPRQLYIGSAGDLTVLLVDDTAPVLFKAVPAGTVLNIRPIRVMASGTGASNIVGLY